MNALPRSPRTLALHASCAALLAAGALAAGCAADSPGAPDSASADSPAPADPGASPAARTASPEAQDPAEQAGVPCPADEVFARAFGAGARVLRVTPLSLPVTGVSACSAKVVEEGGRGRIVTLDEAGNELDAEDLLEEERIAARKMYGALRPELHEALKGADPAQNVSVWIWAKMTLDTPDRDAAVADPRKGEALTREAARRAMAALAPVEEELARRGIEVMDRDGLTPMLRAVVTVADLRELAKMDAIMTIGSDDWPGRPTSTAWYSTIGAATAHLSATGTGQKACVIEGGRPDDTSQLELAGTASPTGYTDAHIRWTSGIIRNTSSTETAPNASVYIGNWHLYSPTAAAPSVWQWCMNNGARQLNFSWTFSDGSPGGLSGSDMAMDYLSKLYPYPLIVPAAGNNGGDPDHATVVNRGRNVLVVGASDDKGTTSLTDDTIAGFSSYKNPTSAHNDRELPNLVAPGVAVSAAGLNWNGTSGAAPQATGASALVGSRNSTLDAWPEVKRAVLMASAVRNIDGSSILSLPTSDTKDGAGLLDAAGAVSLAAPANWRLPGSAAASAGYNGQFLQFSSIPDSSYLPQVWNAVAPTSGRMRFVLAFDGSATCSSDLSSCSGDSLDADLDIVVQNSAGTTLCWSTSYDSSWEMCDLQVVAGQTYQIKVWKWNHTASVTWMGLAWSHYTP